MQRIIDCAGSVTGNPEYRMASPVNITISEGEHIIVTGDNAAGKTRLVEMLAGIRPVAGDSIRYDFSPSPLHHASENIRYITFRDSYGDSDSSYYLQKRWNQQDIDEGTPTARQILERAYTAAESAAARSLGAEGAGKMSGRRYAFCKHLCDMFGLEPLLDKYVITLSSGELRKFHLTKELIFLPRVLVIDNPFLGLDAGAREQMSDFLDELAGMMPITIILVVPRLDTIPPFITHIIPVNGLEVGDKVTVDKFTAAYGESGRTHCDAGGPAAPDGCPILPDNTRRAILDFPVKDLTKLSFYPSGDDKPEIVRCDGVSIRYGDRTILDNLNWTVHEGERWAVRGENGAGKSTLLSLICADNPQSYACRIELFGHKRGSGESIWEIKRHIGYVSPELHRAYSKNISALDTVASGLFDTVGMAIHPDDGQISTCLQWMDIFGIRDLADRPFLRLSSGEQRLCLLARAFVKDPELLILDEPLHGLDAKRSALARQIIDSFVQRPHKTLVMVTHYDSELPDCITHRLVLKRVTL